MFNDMKYFIWTRLRLKNKFKFDLSSEDIKRLRLSQFPFCSVKLQLTSSRPRIILLSFIFLIFKKMYLHKEVLG